MARSQTSFERTSGTTPTRGRLGVDFATLLGLLGAFGVIGAAIVVGGSPGAYLDPAAFLIVGGGTVTVTAVSFSARDLGIARRTLATAVIRPVWSARAVARQMLLLAETARRGSTAMLRDLLPELRSEPFLHRCVTLIAEGHPPDEIERVLGGEAEAATGAMIRTAAVLRRAAEVAPAMGLIGTLVGLVQMLGSLNNPAAIGPGMAVALLTTLYGAMLGNMVLTPLAGKLETAAEHDGLIRSLYLTGSVSIARQENPRRLEMLLNSLLPPGSRVQYFER